MTPRFRFVLVALAVTVVPASPRAAGFEVGEVGAVALGRGGAFVARADDLTALWINPAGLAIQDGTRLLGSVELPRQSLTFTRAGLDGEGLRFRPVSNQGGFGVIPFGAASTDFGSKGMTLAIGGFGPSAYGRPSFDPEGPQRFQLVKMDLMLAFYGLGVGWRPHRDLDIGASILLGHLIRARISKGLNAWFGSAQGPDSGYDMVAHLDFRDAFGFGIVLGALYRPPVPGLQIGLAVRPFPVHFDLGGTLAPEYPGAYLDRLASKGRVYLTNDQVRTSLDLPVTARLGIRWSGKPGGRDVDVEADVAWEHWSMTDAMDVRFDGALAIRQDLGPDDLHPIHTVSIPRRWRDTVSVRLGSDVAVVPGWLTLRAGANWESAAVPQSTTSLDFVSFQRFGVSAGLTVSMRPVDLSIGYSHVFQLARTVAPGTSEVVVAMPMSPCQPPYDDPGCEVAGRAPGPEVGAGRYVSGFDLLTIAVGVRFGP